MGNKNSSRHLDRKLEASKLAQIERPIDTNSKNFGKVSLGIFWDIENCCIPAHKSAAGVAKQLRDFVGGRHPECSYAKEFFCVCDTRKLDPNVSEALNRSGVFVLHVNANSKNAADDRLQELIDMFVDKFGTDSVLAVITSDINFAKPIRNARRNGVEVILIHGYSCSQDLKNLVIESYLFDDIVKCVGYSDKDANRLNSAYLKVSDLPKDKPNASIKQNLSRLSDNCGGKPGYVSDGNALIRFGCRDDAQRALQRMAGEECFGHKFEVNLIEDNLNGTEENRNGTDIWNKDATNTVASYASVVGTGITSSVTNGWIYLWLDQMNRYELKWFVLSNSLLNYYRNSSEGNSFGRQLCLGSIDLKSAYITTGADFDFKIIAIIGDKSFRLKFTTELERQKWLSAFNWFNVRMYRQFDTKPDNKSNVCDDKKISKSQPIQALNTVPKLALNTVPNQALNTVPNRALNTVPNRLLNVVPNLTLNTVPNRALIGFANSRKSVIIGFDVKNEDNLAKTVRKLVISWNDRRLNGNFIDSVVYDKRFVGVVAKRDVPLLVIATSTANCTALVNAAKTYIKSNVGIVWIHYNLYLNAIEAKYKFKPL